MSRQLVTNVRAVRPEGVAPTGWVLIEDGKFADFGTGKAPAGPFDSVIDGDGALMMPGLIDTHVHFREPGMTAKATVASESAAALRGGVTMVFDMPNTIPPTTTAEAFEAKVALFERDCLTNFRIFLGAAPGVMNELPRINRERLAGVKLFWGATTGSTGMPAPEELDELFRYCAREDIVIMVHAEDNAIIAENTATAIERYGSREAVPVTEHNRIRSAQACYEASRQAIELARKHGTRLHLAHVTTIEELQLLQAGDLADKLITAETTPLYTNISLANPAHMSVRIKVNPAVKGVDEALALQQALKDDILDTLGTDHAPHQWAEKQGGALTAASGAPWIQFALPLLLETFTPELIAKKMAQAPAQLFRLEGVGELKVGNKVAFSLVKEVEPYTVQDADVTTPCAWTPLAGLTLRHRVIFTQR